jgi:Dolichyl-phosphate-mannose-protein mannosyltransferase
MTRANAACAASFGLALVVGVVTAARHFPNVSMYHTSADEGAYYNQAVTIRAEGLRGFRSLAGQYLASKELQGLPAPNRVGHILLASLAVRFSDSMMALSVLSLVCFVIAAVAVFAFAWQYFDPLTAAIAGALAAFSPLGLGLARRALMDSDYALWIVLALFLFVHWLSTGSRAALAGLASALFCGLLVKETTWLFVPFFVVTALLTNRFGRRRPSFTHIALFAVIVPVAAIGVQVALLGVNPFVEIVRTSGRMNALSPNPYLVAYGSGPWFEYFIALLLLSPVVALLFLVFAGGYLGAARWHLPTTILLGFFAYAVAVLTLVPKNPRLILPLDAVVRIGAAALITLLVARARRWGRRAALLAGGGLLVAALLSDVTAFGRYFAQLDIYDPVTFTLLERSRMTPPAANWGGEKMADEYLELSDAYYRAGDFQGAVRAARTALLWRPRDARAADNLARAQRAMAERAAKR